MAFCQNCGTELPEGAAFCPGCGAAVPGRMEERQTAPEQLEARTVVTEKEHNLPYTFEDVKPTKKKKGRVGKFVLLIVLAFITILIIGAFGNKSSKNKKASEAAKMETMSDNAADDAEENSADVWSSAETSEEESADDESVQSEETEVQIGNLIFGIPAYYSLGESEEEEDGTDEYMYEYDMSDTGAAILLISSPASGINKTGFREKKDALRELALGMLGTDESMNLSEEKEIEYMNMPGYSYTLNGQIEGFDATIKEEFFLDEENKLFYAFLFVRGDGVPDDIADDYENMLKCGRKASENEDENTIDSSDDVDPNLKETLDAYERMMNEYCDFMEKYENADSSDVISMLGDYSKMLSEYADAMDKLNELDTSKMSTADYKYYLDVTTRVSKRLLDVAS